MKTNTMIDLGCGIVLQILMKFVDGVNLRHGILQIIGQSENPPGVKIRYKLVREAGKVNA